MDAYDEKHGDVTLDALEDELGPLPRTAVSSRRFKTHPVSGIRWFRVPLGVDTGGWKNPGPGIETIRNTWRFAVVAPSVVEGQEYQWLNQVTGEIASTEDGPPGVDDLAMLPTYGWRGSRRTRARPIPSSTRTR